MEIERVKIKCAVCGKESEQMVVISNYVSGAPDLDLKPNGSMMGIGENVQECPYCHYCNYDISQAVQSRLELEDSLKLWENDEDIQNIIKSDENPTVKKFLLLAELYRGNLEYEKALKALISASWVTSDDKAKELRNQALSLYISNVIPRIRTKLLQMADIARQNEEYDVALSLVDALTNLLNKKDCDYKELKSFAKFEKKLIKEKDNQRHNSREAK